MDLLLVVRLSKLRPTQLAQIDELQRRGVAQEDELAWVQEGHVTVDDDGDLLDMDGLVDAVSTGVDAQHAVEILKSAHAA